MSNGETLHIYKAGPFTTFGNEAWHSVAFDGILAEYKGRTDVGIKAYLVHPVDERGDSYGRPPIQVHHWHVAEGQCDQMAGSVYFPNINIQQSLNAKVPAKARQSLINYTRQIS